VITISYKEVITYYSKLGNSEFSMAEVLNNRVSETVFFNKRNQRAHTDPRLQAVETISTGHVTNIFEL